MNELLKQQIVNQQNQNEAKRRLRKALYAFDAGKYLLLIT
jgi:hypothetical protein